MRIRDLCVLMKLLLCKSCPGVSDDYFVFTKWPGWLPTEIPTSVCRMAMGKLVQWTSVRLEGRRQRPQIHHHFLLAAWHDACCVSSLGLISCYYYPNQYCHTGEPTSLFSGLWVNVSYDYSLILCSAILTCSLIFGTLSWHVSSLICKQ